MNNIELNKFFENKSEGKDFFKIFAGEYGAQLTKDGICAALTQENTGDNAEKIKALCNKLVSCGHILPILTLAMELKNLDSRKGDEAGEYLGAFLNLLNACKGEVKPTNLTISKICEDCVDWCVKQYNAENYDEYAQDMQNEGFEYSWKTDYVSKYVCEKIIGTGYELGQIDKDAVNAFAEKVNDGSAKGVVKTLGWLLHVLYATKESQENKAYLYTNYFFGVLAQNDLKNFNIDAVCEDILNGWAFETLDFTSYAMNVNPKVVKTYEGEDGAYNEEATLNYILEEGFTFGEVFNSPCEELGAALYEFFKKADSTAINNNDEFAIENSQKLNKIISLMSAKSPCYIGNLHGLTALFLLADNREEAGISALTDYFFDAFSLTSIKHTKNIRLALLITYFGEDDYNRKMALFSAINQEQSRLSKKYGGTENENVRKFSNNLWMKIMAEKEKADGLLVLSALEKCLEVLNDESGDNLEKIKEIYKQLEKVIEAGTSFEIDSVEHYRKQIARAEKAFLETFDGDVKDVYEAVTEECKEKILGYLCEGELVYKMIKRANKREDWNKIIEYTPATISMTKALEYLGNIIYRKAIVGATPNRREFGKYFYDNAWKDEIELGSIAYMFNTDRLPKFSDESDPTYPKLFNVISKDKIKKLKGRELTGITDSHGNGLEVIFTDDIEHNMMCIYNSLLHVAQKYRNEAAHKNPLHENDCDACKELMVTSQYLLWILLYIMLP